MTAQQLDQARQRAAELLKLVQTKGFDRNSMPKVPIAPFLRGSPPSTQGPADQQSPRPSPDDPPRLSTSADPWVGTWQGTARDRYEDGTLATYPVRLKIQRTADGYMADVTAEK